jgi:hypothetical protein
MRENSEISVCEKKRGAPAFAFNAIDRNPNTINKLDRIDLMGLELYKRSRNISD